jgi:hypothetical protein
VDLLDLIAAAYYELASSEPERDRTASDVVRSVIEGMVIERLIPKRDTPWAELTLAARQRFLKDARHLFQGGLVELIRQLIPVGPRRTGAPDVFVRLLNEPEVLVQDAFKLSEAYACGATEYCTELAQFDRPNYADAAAKHTQMTILRISATHPPDKTENAEEVLPDTV